MAQKDEARMRTLSGRGVRATLRPQTVSSVRGRKVRRLPRCRPESEVVGDAHRMIGRGGDVLVVGRSA